MIDLRQADLNDAAELARIEVDSCRAFDKIFTPAYMASHNTFENRFLYWMNLLTRDVDRTYLIVADGADVGFVTLGYPRDEDAPAGTLQLINLYLRTSAIARVTAPMSCGGCSPPSKPRATTGSFCGC